jgi:hypothetical protein
MNATTNNFFFAKKKKKNGPRKPEMFDCYHLNPARTRTLSVLPDPTLGMGRAENRGPGLGPCRPLREMFQGVYQKTHNGKLFSVSAWGNDKCTSLL